MKRSMKKLTALVLSVMMMLSMALSVSAAEGTNTNNGTITITKAKAGQTYTIYKIFELESYSDSTDDATNSGDGAYSYKMVEAWDEFFADTTIKSTYGFDVNAEGYVTWDSTKFSATTAQAFAQSALAWAKENNISAAESKTATTDNDASVKFENLSLGYYLVDSTTGALCSLNTTNPTVDMVDKNDVPEIDKDVKEGTTWDDNNTAGIGDTVEFRAVITAKAGAQNYVLHDKMSEGLTFTGVSEVKLFNADDEIENADGTKLTETTDYVVKSGEDVEDVEDEEDKDTFAVKIIKELEPGQKVVVYYTAKVNENAVIRGNGNPNDAELQYGDDKRTGSSTTNTKVYDFNVFKFEKNTDASVETGLAGAEFELYKVMEGEETICKFTKEDGESYRLTANGNVEKITTTADADGKFTVKGLDAGTYLLKEVKAPNGYNKLKEPVTVTIGEDGKVSYKYLQETVTNGESDFQVKVENKTGIELPSTGGMGTTVLTIVGILAMAAAVFYFAMGRKRRN